MDVAKRKVLLLLYVPFFLGCNKVCHSQFGDDTIDMAEFWHKIEE